MIAFNSPVYTAADGSSIDVQAQFVVGGPFVPYTALQNDPSTAANYATILAAGGIAPFVPPSFYPLPPALLQAAGTALENSSDFVLRYLEVGLPVPPGWVAYRNALREITSGLDNTATVLPAQPPYP